jgi:hypothetical protein
MVERKPIELSITIHVGEMTLPTLWVTSKNKAGNVDRNAIKTTALGPEPIIVAHELRSKTTTTKTGVTDEPRSDKWRNA